MSDLPPGWVEAELDEIADVTLGQSPPGTSYNSDGAGMPFLQGKTEFGELRPTVRKWTTDPRKIANVGDVLLSVRAPVGPTNLAPFECCIGRGLAAVRPLGGIEPLYVLYGIRATERVLAARATGTTFEAVSGAQVRTHPVSIAPLAEQRRIVAAIEEQLSRLDAANASLAAATLRVGALIRPIRELAVASGRDHPLADLLDGIEAGRSFKCHGRPAESDEWGVIKVSAMTWGSFREEENKAVLSNERVDPRWEIRPGDLLLSRANTTDYVGASVLVGECRSRLLLSDKSMRLLVKDGVHRPWLWLALSAPTVRAQMSAVATGTSDSMRNVSQAKVGSVRLRVPPVEEQRRIVSDVDQRLSVINAMRGSIERARRRSTVLRLAILERAFRGELVPQDLTDEPASVLLERIRAERDVAGAIPRRRRVTT